MKTNAASVEELLTSGEVADRLSLSRYTIMKYKRDGLIRAYLNTPNGPRFLWSEVLEDLAKIEGRK